MRGQCGAVGGEAGGEGRRGGGPGDGPVGGGGCSAAADAAGGAGRPGGGCDGGPRGGGRRLLIVGGKRKPVERARALGLEVALVQKKASAGAEVRAADYAFLFDYEDPALLSGLGRAIFGALPFSFALSFTEHGLVPAARLSEELGLYGNPLRTVMVLRDKWEMRQLLNRSGISPVAAAPGGCEADVRAFLAEVGGPALLKPVDGTASYGVVRVDGPGEAGAACRRLAALGVVRFIMEEFLEGPEVSVESFSAAGRHYIVAVTDKRILPNYVEIGHSIPSRLRGQEREAVCRLVREFLDAVGLVFGPAHTEVKLTARGPRIVESHNRAGGDKITDLVEIVYGVDFYTLSYQVLFGLGEPGLETLESRPARCGAAVRFFVAPPGTVVEVIGEDALKREPGVHTYELEAKVGDRVNEVRDSRDRLGHVIVTAETAEAASAVCDRLEREVRFVTR
ncbi:MAG: ATP-grasp domain-containing protein [Acetobacteraceae bacterium]|nr:ATP-grasp domain-containing protein [Acetobacteraceae bacterium]